MKEICPIFQLNMNIYVRMTTFKHTLHRTFYYFNKWYESLTLTIHNTTDPSLSIITTKKNKIIINKKDKLYIVINIIINFIM